MSIKTQINTRSEVLPNPFGEPVTGPLVTDLVEPLPDGGDGPDTATSLRPCLVMGIGNLVLQDEGFGVHVVQELQRTGQLPDSVDLLDGGCAGLHLMGYLQNYRRLIVIDAALDNNPIGTVRRLRPSFGEFPPLVTAHEIGLKDVLEALQLTGYCPDTEMIVCSVKKYDSLGTTLSPAVSAAIPTAIAHVMDAVAGQR